MKINRRWSNRWWAFRRNLAVLRMWFKDLFTPDLTDQEWESLDSNLQALIQRDIVNSKEIARNLRMVPKVTQ